MKYFIDEYKRKDDRGQILRTFQVVDEKGNHHRTFNEYSKASKVAHDLAGSPDNVEYRDRGFEESPL